MEPTKVFTATVVTNGRITIPEEVRKILSIQEGDTIQCEILTIKKREASS